jgi:hypothetical protein
MSKASRFVINSIFSLAILSIACGCATSESRVDQFDTFARAGVTFAESVPPVLEDSLASTINTDSLVLLQAREGLDADGRLLAIEQSQEDLEQRVEILNALRRHVQLLRAYFVAIGDLAAIDAQSSGLSDVADGFVQELTQVSPAISRANIGGFSVTDAVGPAAEFVVAARQSAALQQELRRNAETIDRELRLQQAALDALADAMRAEMETRLALRNRDLVTLPFVRDEDVPSDWVELRLELLREHLDVQSVDAAREAARSLRIGFIALVEGNLGEATLGALISDISSLVGAIENARTN